MFLLQELVVEVDVVASRRHDAVSCVRRCAVAKLRLSGRR